MIRNILAAIGIILVILGVLKLLGVFVALGAAAIPMLVLGIILLVVAAVVFDGAGTYRYGGRRY